MSAQHKAPRPTRAAAVAGRFYPDDSGELRRSVEQMLAKVQPCTGASLTKIIISPHAGYMFSGPIAASAFAQLAPDRDRIRRVVLLGPSHFVAFSGLALPTAAWFETPLGQLLVDAYAAARISHLPQVRRLDEAHAREHSIEVQLPFLQVVLEPGSFSIVPLVVGEATQAEVAEVIEVLWGGAETRFIISSDLSHFLEAPVARRIDAQTACVIEELAPERLGDDQACGRVPLRGMLHAARNHHLSVRTLELRNSGDTGGPPGRVVGYGAFALSEAEPAVTSA